MANLFSGRWEGSIERDDAGRYFLDFDPGCFRIVLNALRSQRLATCAVGVRGRRWSSAEVDRILSHYHLRTWPTLQEAPKRGG